MNKGSLIAALATVFVFGMFTESKFSVCSKAKQQFKKALDQYYESRNKKEGDEKAEKEEIKEEQ